MILPTVLHHLGLREIRLLLGLSDAPGHRRWQCWLTHWVLQSTGGWSGKSFLPYLKKTKTAETRPDFDSRSFNVLAIHHGGRFAARTASGSSRVLHKKDAALPGTRGATQRPRLHQLCPDTLSILNGCLWNYYLHLHWQWTRLPTGRSMGGKKEASWMSRFVIELTCYYVY